MKNILLFYIFLGLVSCGQNKVSETNKNKLPEDFVSFYHQFLNDPEFQLEHISFPLSGIPNQAKKSDYTNFRWSKVDWKIHKEVDDPEYVSSFELIRTNLIEETIFHQRSGFGFIRRYSKIGENWYLIYYVGMNSIK